MGGSRARLRGRRGARMRGRRQWPVVTAVGLALSASAVLGSGAGLPAWASTASAASGTTSSTQPASGAASPAGAAARASVFYLDLGASVSVGVQPSAGSPHGAPTHRGFANDLVRREARAGLHLHLVEVGCPGETVESMVSGADRCYHPPASQLATAVAFLRAHRRDRGIVTVDIGFNDVRPCLRAGQVHARCVTSAVARVGRTLPEILRTLRRAAGPHVHMIGIGPYDPFLGTYLDGAHGRVFASKSLRVMQRLTLVEQRVYAAGHVSLADLLTTFESFSRSHVRWHHRTVLPLAVARICALSWMCHGPPLGPNIHPDASGYRLIAGAVARLLTEKGWAPQLSEGPRTET